MQSWIGIISSLRFGGLTRFIYPCDLVLISLAQAIQTPFALLLIAAISLVTRCVHRNLFVAPPSEKSLSGCTS
jgi:hypothetical protein